MVETCGSGLQMPVLCSETDVLPQGLHEHFGGWDNVGHNDLFDLIFLWIIPK